MSWADYMHLQPGETEEARLVRLFEGFISANGGNHPDLQKQMLEMDNISDAFMDMWMSLSEDDDEFVPATDEQVKANEIALFAVATVEKYREDRGTADAEGVDRPRKPAKLAKGRVDKDLPAFRAGDIRPFAKRHGVTREQVETIRAAVRAARAE